MRSARILSAVLLFPVFVVLTTLDGQGAREEEDFFADLFTGNTLRFDYFHSGTAEEEQVSIDRYRLEGEWPGSRTQLIDSTNLGKYLFEVFDGDSGNLLYSRAFAGIYGEWETTGEARQGIWRTFHESQRFPEPRKPCRLVLKKRNRTGRFEPLFETEVDAGGRHVDRSALNPVGSVLPLFEHGAPAVKVDLLVLGDGYMASEREKFQDDVSRLVEVLFDTEPFRSRRADFNVRMLHVPAEESGISDPRRGIWRNSPLGLSFNAFDTDRYVLTYRNQELREIAAQAPYDALMLLFNGRKYGGGGIFNLWATCASDTKPAPYVFVHEFGHSFAGLADEYYTSEVAYEDFTPQGVEPWEPNLTALLDPASLKWRDLVASGTPLPTPWGQERFDRVSADYNQRRRQLISNGAPDTAMEELFDEVKEATSELLDRESYTGKVGAFEGAGYEAKGLYRPELDCIMFSRNPRHFCRVCSRAIDRIIDLYSE